MDDSMIAEHDKLYAEIASNSQTTANVFTFAITAVSALLGYGIQAENWAILLTPFAVLLPSLWYIASQLESTTRIASYVRVFIEPRAEGLNWETRLAKMRVACALPEKRYTLSITGIYGALGVCCLAVSWAYVGDSSVNRIVLGAASVILGAATLALSLRCRGCFSAERQREYDKSWQKLLDSEEKAASDSLAS